MRGRAITKLTYPSAQSSQAFRHHVRRQDDGSINPILGLTNMQTFTAGLKCHIVHVQAEYFICAHPGLTQDRQDKPIWLRACSNRNIHCFQVAFAVNRSREMRIFALSFDQSNGIVYTVSLAHGPHEKPSETGDSPIGRARHLASYNQE